MLAASVFLSSEQCRLPPLHKATAWQATTLGMTDGLRPSHIQLPPQNSVQEPEQRKARSDQHDGVEDEYINLHSKIPLVLTEKHVRFSTAAIITLLHLRVRNQIRYFLIQIERLRRYRTIGILELGAIKRLLAIEYLINRPKVPVQIIRRFCLQARQHGQCIL